MLLLSLCLENVTFRQWPTNEDLKFVFSIFDFIFSTNSCLFWFPSQTRFVGSSKFFSFFRPATLWNLQISLTYTSWNMVWQKTFSLAKVDIFYCQTNNFPLNHFRTVLSTVNMIKLHQITIDWRWNYFGLRICHWVVRWKSFKFSHMQILASESWFLLWIYYQ